VGLKLDRVNVASSRPKARGMAKVPQGFSPHFFFLLVVYCEEYIFEVLGFFLFKMLKYWILGLLIMSN
jgi:hypothetical protein